MGDLIPVDSNDSGDPIDDDKTDPGSVTLNPIHGTIPIVVHKGPDPVAPGLGVLGNKTPNRTNCIDPFTANKTKESPHDDCRMESNFNGSKLCVGVNNTDKHVILSVTAHDGLHPKTK